MADRSLGDLRRPALHKALERPFAAGVSDAGEGDVTRFVLPTALPRQFGIVQSAEAWRLDQARRTFEEQFVRAALVRSGGRRGRAAAELGVTRQGLTKLMSRLGIAD